MLSPKTKFRAALRRGAPLTLCALLLGPSPAWAQTAPPTPAPAPGAQNTSAAAPPEAEAGAAGPRAPAAGGQAALTVAAAALDPMTIFGSAEALPRTVGSAHLLDEEALATYAYDDIHRVLGRVPGLYLRGEDGFGLRPNIGLRGANSDRSQKVTLMEDGVLFGPAPYAAPAAYYFPLLARMQGVEVYKGPAAVPYGPQTIGGAINLLSAPLPEEFRAQAGLAVGSDGYRRAQGLLGQRWERQALQAELVHIGSEGFKRLPRDQDTGFGKTEGLLKWGRPLAGGELQLRAGAAREYSNETYLGLTEADFRAAPERRYLASERDRMDWDWQGLRADWSRALAGGQLLLTAYDHRFSRAWTKFNNFRGADVRNVLAQPDTPSNRLYYESLTGATDTDPTLADDDLLIGTNDRDFRSSGLQGRWDRALSGGEWAQQWSLGLRLHSDRITRLHDEDSFEIQDGALLRNTVPRAITADNTGRAEALALWARDELSRGRWTLVPGLRVEHVRVEFADRRAGEREAQDYTVWLPGLGLHFAQSAQLSWLAGLHRGFSPASPGLNRAEPELAWNAEAGLRWRDARFGRWEAIAFYSDYENLSAVCTFSAGCDDAVLGQQTNAGRVRVHGLELVAERRFALPAGLSLPAALSYTYTQGEFREAFTSANPQFGTVAVGDELPYVPEQQASLSLGLEGARWQLEGVARYVAAMRDSAGSGPIPPASGSDAYTVVDLAARVFIDAQWTLQARADNLLDREYVSARRPFGARPGKPRSLPLGVEYRY